MAGIEVNLPEVRLPKGSMEFVQRILGPVAEVGDFLSEKIRFYRWKSSLKVFEEANKIAKERGIDPKQIPLKILVPLIEKSSLEEENSPLIDTWAKLLAQAASDPHSIAAIFVDILSRLTPDEVKYVSEIISDDFLDQAEKEILEGGSTSPERTINILIDAHVSMLRAGMKNVIDDNIDNPDIMKIISQEFKYFNGCIYENLNLDSNTGGASIAYIHTRRFDRISAIDVLIACGLLTRRVTTLANGNATGSLSIIAPTLLGVRFVAACKARKLF